MTSEYVRVQQDGETCLARRRYADPATIIDDNPTLTVDEMCDLMFLACERENYHSLAGLPTTLVDYLREAGASQEIIAAFVQRFFDAGGPMSFA